MSHSVACRITFSTNNLMQSFSIHLYQSLTMEEFCPPHNTASVSKHSFMHSSLKVIPQHFICAELYTLHGPLEAMHYFKTHAKITID